MKYIPFTTHVSSRSLMDKCEVCGEYEHEHEHDVRATIHKPVHWPLSDQLIENGIVHLVGGDYTYIYIRCDIVVSNDDVLTLTEVMES